MKQILLSALLLIFATRSFCQITVTENAYPAAGDVWLEYYDYTDSGYVLTAPSGVAQTWNYANVFQESGASTYIYQDASSFAYSGPFPDAMLGVLLEGYTNFYNSDASGFYLTGVYFRPQPGVYDTTENWTPPTLQFPVPFTYNNTRHYTSESVTSGYDVSISKYSKQISYIEGDFTADAFGTITTPGLTNVPVLRLSNTYHEFDTVYLGHTPSLIDSLFDTVTSYYVNYYFVQNKSPYLVMEIDFDPALQQVTNATYVTLNAGNSANEINNSPVFTNVFPNPSASSSITFTIEGGNACYLKIYNMMGQCVETENVTGINAITISNGLLSHGLYFYQLTDRAGNITEGKKFVVQ